MNTKKQFEQMSEQEKEAMAGDAMLVMLSMPAKLDALTAALSTVALAMQAQAHAMNALAASNEELANALLQDLRDAQDSDDAPQASTLDEEL